MARVYFTRKTAPSGRLLKARLDAAGYDGPGIVFGKLNNKREALVTLNQAGIRIPTLTFEWPDYPCVGRPDNHSKGRWMYRNAEEVNPRRPPTHFLRWVNVQKEFRVHVVDGRVIKLQEKIPVGNFIDGVSHFVWPNDFSYKNSLRKRGKDAVRAMGFDFGAVDILWGNTDIDSHMRTYVIEVNSAPKLTNENADTLDRYVTAFMRR